jgi:hypothetical protein
MQDRPDIETQTTFKGGGDGVTGVIVMLFFAVAFALTVVVL